MRHRCLSCDFSKARYQRKLDSLSLVRYEMRCITFIDLHETVYTSVESVEMISIYTLVKCGSLFLYIFLPPWTFFRLAEVNSFFYYVVSLIVGTGAS